jgi:DNA-binding transcriptional regulator YiaG
MAMAPARHITKLVNKDSSPAAPDVAHAGADSDRIRSLLVASGLSAPEAARALGVDEKTLLYWCQSNGKLLPPRWAIQMLSRLVAMRKKARDL